MDKIQFSIEQYYAKTLVKFQKKSQIHWTKNIMKKI